MTKAQANEAQLRQEENKPAGKARVKPKGNSRGTKIFIVCMMAWPLLHFAVFWVYVNANTFYLTFFQWDPQHAVYEWYGLQRFKDILDSIFVNPDASIINYIKNSLWVFPVQNFIMLPLSFLLAFYLSKKMPAGGVFRVIFFLPSIISTVVLAKAYRYMFNSNFGPADALVEAIFGSSPDWFDSMGNWAMPLIFFFTVWSGLGYKMLLLQGAIERIPQEIIEASKLDGVPLYRELFSITFPLVMPTLTTFFVTNTLAVFSYYMDPMLLGGESGGVNGSTGTVALRVAYMMQNGKAEDAAAFGLLFSLVGMPVVLFIKWMMEKLTPDVEF